MKTFKCLGRFRDTNGKVTGYKLVDEAGNTRDVETGKLMDALKSGEAMVINLTLGANGKLSVRDVPKVNQVYNVNLSADGKVTPAENGDTPTKQETGKIVSFDAMKSYKSGGNLLVKMLECFEFNELTKQARIIECEYDKYKDEAYALVILHNKVQSIQTRILLGDRVVEDYEEVEFKISKKDSETTYYLKTQTGEYDAETLEDAIGKLEEDLDTFCALNRTTYRRIGGSMVAEYNSSRNIANQFGMMSRNDGTLKVAGNNIVYLKSTNDIPTIVIPKHVTVVCNGAFDYNYNLKEIKCPIHLFRAIGNMIDNDKIYIERA